MRANYLQSKYQMYQKYVSYVGAYNTIQYRQKNYMHVAKLRLSLHFVGVLRKICHQSKLIRTHMCCTMHVLQLVMSCFTMVKGYFTTINGQSIKIIV